MNRNRNMNVNRNVDRNVKVKVGIKVTSIGKLNMDKDLEFIERYSVVYLIVLCHHFLIYVLGAYS